MNLKIRMHAAPTISRARLMNKHLTEQTSPILPIFLHKSQKIKNSFFIMQTADRSYKTQITQQKRVHWFGAIRFWCNFNWFLIKFVTKFEQKSIKIAPKSNRTKPMNSSLISLLKPQCARPLWWNHCKVLPEKKKFMPEYENSSYFGVRTQRDVVVLRLFNPC